MNMNGGSVHGLSMPCMSVHGLSLHGAAMWDKKRDVCVMVPHVNSYTHISLEAMFVGLTTLVCAAV
jgi:hypothetical protein